MTGRVDDEGHVMIPKHLRERYGFAPGTEVNLVAGKRGVVFYPAGVDQILKRFARPVPKRIGRHLLTRPMTKEELKRRLGCAESTLQYHLERMMEVGDVVQDASGGFSLSRPETVKKAFAGEAMGWDRHHE